MNLFIGVMMPRPKRNPSVEYVPFTIRIPQAMKKQIEERAIENLRSASQEAEFLIRTALEILKSPEPKKEDK
jgi:hypothetical protein